MRTPRREHREVAMVPLAGTCLSPGITWMAVVDEAIVPGVRFPSERRQTTLSVPTAGLMRYVREGTSRVPGVEHHFTPGALIAHAGGQAWAVVIDGPRAFASQYVIMTGPLATRLDGDLAELDGMLDDRSPPPLIRAALQRAVRMGLERPSGWDWQVLAALAQVAAHIHEVCHRGGGTMLERLGRLIDTAPEEPWRLARVAAVFGMGHAEFVHAFSSEAGEGPASWIRRRRMDHARQRLALGERPTAVATALGFPTLAAFSRTFFATVGCRPTEYGQRQSSLPKA